MVISVVVNALATILKGLEKSLEELEIRKRIKTNSKALLRSVRIFLIALETWEDLISLQQKKNYQLKLVWKT